MSFKLPDLPYGLNALAPLLSQETMEFHYGKHHKTYIDKLNGLLPGSGFEKSTLDEIVMKSEGGIFNNAAQAWNHTFYWLGLRPAAQAKPLAQCAGLKKALESSFGSIEDFQKKFADLAAGVFGSGWAWLTQDASGSLKLVGTSNAENPMRKGEKPLLVCDVWEHAYYIDYRNARPKYVEGFWKLIHWEFVEQNLNAKNVLELHKSMKA